MTEERTNYAGGYAGPLSIISAVAAGLSLLGENGFSNLLSNNANKSINQNTADLMMKNSLLEAKLEARDTLNEAIGSNDFVRSERPVYG